MPKQKFDSDKLDPGPEGALIIHPVLKTGSLARSQEAMIEEISGLARAIALDVVDVRVLNVSRIQAGAYFGSGQQEQLAAYVQEVEPHIVIVNASLSPVQQRNLEGILGAKVIDRTGLILEIFGARAQTKEGRFQVELAALEYQKSRLVRSWTHLERQRGGAGFMGGPGERQIEIDRRLINERITKLKKELSVVKRTRDLGRASRARVPFPTVALVGYTNAGKSTLFNALTGADVFAEDLPFATLDPTLRKIELPNGQSAILSDTVGFITDLPTHLIAAFRATLEETIHADVLVHVIDCARSDYKAQRNDVIEILEGLGIEYEDNPNIIEVYNKIDALEEGLLNELQRKSNFDDQIQLVSAKNKQGFDVFLDSVTQIIAKKRQTYAFLIPYADGAALSWLHEHAEMLERDEGEQGVRVLVSMEDADLSKFESRFGNYRA